MVPIANKGENGPPDLSLQQIYNSEVNEMRSSAPQSYTSGMTSNPSSLGMDLGEFMLEGDIEFMNELAGMGQLMAMERNMGTGGNPNPQQDVQNSGVIEATGV